MEDTKGEKMKTYDRDKRYNYLKDLVRRRNNHILSECMRDSRNLAYALRPPMAMPEEFQDEKFVRFHSSIITSMVRSLQARHPMPIDILRIMFGTLEGLDDQLPDSFTQQPAYMVFQGLSISELEQLRHDVKSDLDYISSADSTTGIMHHCWEAILAVCEGELAQSKIVESGHLKAIEEYALATGKLQSSSYSELQRLQWEMESEIALSPSRPMSTENQHLCQLIHFFKAKIFLKENHGCRRLGYRLMSEDKVPPYYQKNKALALSERADELAKRFLHIDKDTRFKTISAMFGLHDDEEEYKKFRERASIAMAAAGRSGTKERNIEPFSYPSILEYEWNDKYLPIKPMHSSRVEYGPQLNSYNEYHIDCGKPLFVHVVKAYKFNIFYPDIVDKRKLQFFVEYNKNITEYCVLRIQAGPPYQDICFRIVNEEWDLNSFKWSFEEGILHLYFDLKGYWYRH